MDESLDDPYLKYYVYLYVRLKGGWYYNFFTSTLPSSEFRERYFYEIVPTAIELDDLLSALSDRGLNVPDLIDNNANGGSSRFWVNASAFKDARNP